MWIFRARYIKLGTGIHEVVTKEIQFDGDNVFDNDKECYMHAMSRACNMREEDEMLESVEIIACRRWKD